jgi:outer membrane protein assembly factor BamB
MVWRWLPAFILLFWTASGSALARGPAAHLSVSPLHALAGGTHLRDPQFRVISFDDLKPAGARVAECWQGIGIDRRQRVYLGVSDRGGANPDDAIIFRYDSNTGGREFLSTLRTISTAEGNAHPGETFAKIHTGFYEHDGKMYFASHDFHGLDDPMNHRGGHFYSLDLETDHFEDLSKSDPGGVSIAHQGIIAMDVLTSLNKLVGMTFMSLERGDILLYDLGTRRTTVYPTPDVPHFNISRKIIGGRNGKAYFSYDAENFWLLRLDPATGMIERTPRQNILRRGFLHGMAKTRDEQTVYVVDLAGHLYQFDVAGEVLTDLGSLMPPSDPREVGEIATLALSSDETKLYTLPYWFERREGPAALFEYDLVTGERRRLADAPEDLWAGEFSGSGVTDSEGRVYFCWHDYASGDRARLLQINGTATLESADSEGSSTTSPSKAGCFIATAAYGTPLAAEVEILRRFRDRNLLPYIPGRILIGLYYRMSPGPARVIASHDRLRAIVRVGLIPVIRFAQLALWCPALGLLTAAGLVLLLPAWVMLLYSADDPPAESITRSR